MENNVFVKILIEQKWIQIKVYKDELRIKTVYLNELKDLEKILEEVKSY